MHDAHRDDLPADRDPAQLNQQQEVLEPGRVAVGLRDRFGTQSQGAAQPSRGAAAFRMRRRQDRHGVEARRRPSATGGHGALALRPSVLRARHSSRIAQAAAPANRAASPYQVIA